MNELRVCLLGNAVSRTARARALKLHLCILEQLDHCIMDQLFHFTWIAYFGRLDQR